MKKREKLGDYILDISKYVLTAVLITLFFNDISSSKFMTYFIGAMVAVITLLWGLALNKNRYGTVCDFFEYHVGDKYYRLDSRIGKAA